MGLIFQLTITGNANTAGYFSKPFLFLASFALLVDLQEITAPTQLRLNLSRITAIGALWLASFLWEREGVARYLWQSASDGILKFDLQQIALLEFVTSGQQSGLGFLCAITLLFASITRRARPSALVGPLLFAFTLTVFTGNSELADSALRRVRGAEEIAGNLGSKESQQVAKWLRETSSQSDLIATNHLIDPESGSLLSDFSLSAWSDREFLVLGPKFLGASSSVESAFKSSMRFGDVGVDTKPNSLAEFGVDFFVFDKKITPWPQRSGLPPILFENERFFVIKF